MDAFGAGVFAVAGALAAIPVTAIAYAVPEHGSIRVPQRWWRGAPARPVAVVVFSLLAGAAAGVVAVRLPLSPALPAFCLFAVVGVGLAVIDIRRRRLPHAMTGALWLTSALGSAIGSFASGQVHAFVVAVSAGLGAVVLAFVLALALPGQLGLGDVSLLGVIAMSLGWLSLDVAAVGLVAGITIQASIALAMMFRGRDRRSQVPMGPALLLGWFVAILLPSGVTAR